MWLCDGGNYGCVPHEGTGVMGVSVFVLMATGVIV